MHPFKRYYCQNYLKAAGVSSFPELMRKIHIFNLENRMNNPAVEWMYKPQLCVLKPQHPIHAFISGAVMGYGCKPIGYRKYKIDIEENEDRENRQGCKAKSPVHCPVSIQYIMCILNTGSSAQGFGQFGGCDAAFITCRMSSSTQLQYNANR